MLLIPGLLSCPGIEVDLLMYFTRNNLGSGFQG